MPAASFVRLPRLRHLRLQALLTQQQLAEMAGIGRVTLARIELGGPTTIVTAQALARALKLEAPELGALPAEVDQQPAQQ